MPTSSRFPRSAFGRAIFALPFALTLAFAPILPSQESVDQTSARITQYLWLVNVDGDARIDDFEAGPDVDFLGLMGHVEARVTDWSLFITPTYITANADDKPGTIAGVDVESAIWDRWVDETSGAIVSIDRFGASAPAGDIFATFGFTPEAITAIARGVMAGERSGRIGPADDDHGDDTTG